MGQEHGFSHFWADRTCVGPIADLDLLLSAVLRDLFFLMEIKIMEPLHISLTPCDTKESWEIWRCPKKVVPVVKCQEFTNCTEVSHLDPCFGWLDTTSNLQYPPVQLRHLHFLDVVCSIHGDVTSTRFWGAFPTVRDTPIYHGR